MFLLLLLGARFVTPAAQSSSLNTSASASPGEQATQERLACSNNLHTIYGAIEAYRRDHSDLPNWFSDLVPDYLPDVNVLVCPTCRRTGRTEDARLADPHIASSYLFEFCPLPLGNSAPANPKATRREWKRKQMGVVGSVVPLVRCRNHTPVLNLAFDGRVYESTPAWEDMLTNKVDPATLSPARMFAAAPAPTGQSKPKKTYPARDAATPAQLLDLEAFYNARLADTWHGAENATGNDLSALPAGIQELNGTQYDIRGVVQLGSKAPSANRFPNQVTGIKVGQKCKAIHFLHSGAFGHPSDEGKQIGVYALHFAANNMRLEVPIVYGKDVRDWHYWAQEQEAPPSLHIAWKGDNPTSKRANSYLRLFETTWTNVVPDIELESIDFVSSMSQPAPFLIAITIE